MFKLGTEGEGYAFFLPDNYRKPLKVIGSGIRRSINGTARRDVIATKYNFEMSFDYVSENEYKNLIQLFFLNIEDGVTLKFTDDEGETYDVIWGSETFGLDERKQDEGIFWSGTILLEQV